MKKNIFAAAIAVVLAFTLAACSGASGAKQIVLHTSANETGKYTVGERANIVGDLDLTDTKASKVDIVIEELVPGGSWTEFRSLTASKSSSSVGFALIKTEAGNYQYRAVVSADGYGPFTSATISVEYSAK